MKSKIQAWKTNVALLRSQRKNRIPPIVASKNEKRVNASYLKKVAKDNKLPNRSLILGATPELRDASIKHQLESHAVDVSKKMIEKLTPLMRYHGHALDKMTLKNWFKMKYPKDYFGIALGDASFNNLVTKRDNIKLTKILEKIICPKGYLILRNVVYPRIKNPFANINELLMKLRKRKISWQDYFVALRIYFFKDKIYNKKTYQYDAKKNFEMIDQLYHDKILRKREYQYVNRFRNDVINSFYPEKKFISIFEKNGFKLIKTYKDKSHFLYNYLYLLIFQKK